MSVSTDPEYIYYELGKVKVCADAHHHILVHPVAVGADLLQLSLGLVQIPGLGLHLLPELLLLPLGLQDVVLLLLLEGHQGLHLILLLCQ